MKAKKNPVKYINKEKQKIYLPIFLIFPQAAAWFLSTGQGIFRLLYIEKAERESMQAAKLNVHGLCALSQTSAGKFELKPAIVAPSPSVTRSAGNAQQNSVVNDENKDNV